MHRLVYVFADWEDFAEPMWVGTLRSSTIKNKEHFSFSYQPAWLQSTFAQTIDPDLSLYAGEQHAEEAKNFRVFLDSCPDRWGRLLMKRREALWASQEKRRPRLLQEIDYLLAVQDISRLGALRFKEEIDGPFLDNARLAVPPLAALKDLQHAAQQVEGNSAIEDPEYIKWLTMLVSPGSSLGGARPKASLIDDQGQLWIAKFPSRYDDYDVAAWEYAAYQLALHAGIEMAESRLEQVNSHHHTFLTKRFDRTAKSRLHFSSAMTQLGYYDGDYDASYLELAQFLTDQGSNTKQDLAQLWRRIVFNIAVSNTDDHLRNHGFIYRGQGWTLAPAYDINPTTPAHGLHLSISDADNRLDYALAMEVIEFFRLTASQALAIKDEVLASVSRWRQVAKDIGIARHEQTLMASAFNV